MSKQTAIQKVELENVEQLKSLLVKLSTETPSKVFTADVTFQTARIYSYQNRSSVPIDSPDSRTMIRFFDSVCFKNGKLMKPTDGWKRRKAEDSFKVR